MEIYEKRNAISEYCAAHHPCSDECLFNDGVSWCDTYNETNAPEEIIEETYNRIFPPAPAPEAVETPHDNVNHPSHYCRESAMECIDEMVLLFGVEAVKHFCLCNSWKYRYRSSAKNGEEDVRKSDWYIQKYKELSSNG